MSDPEYPATGKGWTKKEGDLLKELWPDFSLEQIAPVFKRSPNAIRQKGNDLKLPPKGYPTVIDNDYLEELQKQKGIDV